MTEKWYVYQIMTDSRNIKKYDLIFMSEFDLKMCKDLPLRFNLNKNSFYSSFHRCTGNERQKETKLKFKKCCAGR